MFSMYVCIIYASFSFSFACYWFQVCVLWLYIVTEESGIRYIYIKTNIERSMTVEAEAT